MNSLKFKTFDQEEGIVPLQDNITIKNIEQYLMNMEINDDIESFLLLKSENLTFLINTLKKVLKLKDSKLKSALKEAILWQMEVIAKSIDDRMKF